MIHCAAVQFDCIIAVMDGRAVPVRSKQWAKSIFSANGNSRYVDLNRPIFH
jgi:hypothetical protein